MIQKFSELFSSNHHLEVSIYPSIGRKVMTHTKSSKGQRLYIFNGNEDVTGSAKIILHPGKCLSHSGIKIELIGEICLAEDVVPHSFCHMSKELEPSGILYESKSFDWKFAAVDKPYETFTGVGAKVRYFVRFKVVRQYAPSRGKEAEFVVQNYLMNSPSSEAIKMEVGIEGCLHLDFYYDNSFYHLKDTVHGIVHFLLVRIKISHMEIEIIRTETAKAQGSRDKRTFTSILSRFEIMDGSAVKNEKIPVRLHLRGYNLTPTYENIHNQFSVRYYFNLILIDNEERRYFKRKEIVFYRKYEPDL